MYVQITSPRSPADPDSDVTSAASFGWSDGNSEYVELTKKSPLSSAKTPDLAGHTSELKIMHEVSVGYIYYILLPTLLFSHTDEIGIPKITDAETNPNENLQDNGAVPPAGTHPLKPSLTPNLETMIQINTSISQ